MELIRCENITKTYHVGEIDVPVLKGVSLSIRRGELVALMGASGSGKSTLMNILGCSIGRPRANTGSTARMSANCRRPPGSGANRQAGIRLSKFQPVAAHHGGQQRADAARLLDQPAPRERIARRGPIELLERVGLQDRLDHVPSQMSGGQQQRVAIARSLVNQPALLLADEPTGNLDSHTSVEILEMFQQLNASGLTVILVTHDPKVANYAHRTIRVDRRRDRGGQRPLDVAHSAGTAFARAGYGERTRRTVIATPQARAQRPFARPAHGNGNGAAG